MHRNDSPAASPREISSRSAADNALAGRTGITGLRLGAHRCSANYAGLSLS